MTQHATVTQHALHVPWVTTFLPLQLANAYNAHQSQTVFLAIPLILLNAFSATMVTSLSQREHAQNAVMVVLVAPVPDSVLVLKMDTTSLQTLMELITVVLNNANLHVLHVLAILISVLVV